MGDSLHEIHTEDLPSFFKMDEGTDESGAAGPLVSPPPGRTDRLTVTVGSSVIPQKDHNAKQYAEVR